jgi:hypothetical protein
MANGKAGAPKGNQNGKGRSGTQWKDAIRKALARDKGSLERVAIALIKEAEDGNIAAIKEMGDRLDGKAVQPVIGESDNKLTVEILRFASPVTE